MQAGRLPLEGLKVLEVGTVIAGPYAGSLLADQGAEVIKVENPTGPDPLREMGAKEKGVTLWWGIGVRGKRLVTLNLKHAGGKALFLRLLAEADVLVENYRPGVLDRMGLGWSQLSALHPRLIMLSITGFGQTGPYGPRPGFGKIAEGMSGMVPLTGRPGDSPVHVGFSLADTASGLLGFFALSVALWNRDFGSGKGTHIDLALFESLLRILDCQLALNRAAGHGPERQGTDDPYGWGERGGAVHQALQTADGRWLKTVHASAAAVRETAQRLGLAAADEAAARQALAGWAAARPLEDAGRGLIAAGAAAVPVYDGLTIAADPYFRGRGDTVPAEADAAGAAWVPGPIWRDGATDGRPPFRTGALGRDNAELFGGRLGVPEAELARLKADGAI